MKTTAIVDDDRFLGVILKVFKGRRLPPCSDAFLAWQLVESLPEFSAEAARREWKLSDAPVEEIQRAVVRGFVGAIRVLRKIEANSLN